MIKIKDIKNNNYKYYSIARSSGKCMLNMKFILDLIVQTFDNYFKDHYNKNNDNNSKDYSIFIYTKNNKLKCTIKEFNNTVQSEFLFLDRNGKSNIIYTKRLGYIPINIINDFIDAYGSEFNITMEVKNEENNDELFINFL